MCYTEQSSQQLRILAQQCFPRMCTSIKPQNLTPIKAEQGEAENVTETHITCASDQDFPQEEARKAKEILKLAKYYKLGA